MDIFIFPMLAHFKSEIAVLKKGIIISEHEMKCPAFE